MPSVDDRIVRMEFDNAAFEKKIGTTLTSLDKLNKSLKFEGAQAGLANLSSHVGKFDLRTISDGIENVSRKFLALSAVAITVLANITTKAFEAGAQLAKSLTLDNIIAGFREYEQNMSSIQTILSNTKADGTNLQQVNDALDELNEYSDKTIYNFGQMTKNIGTFTAAGVDLDTSVMSIKGISNLAAISGSSAEQASSAMYQLSQAVSTGTLRLIDWNSVVNAGMGGEVFQKALFETGKAMGTIKDVPITQTFEEWTDAGNTFRGSLEDNWLTADVLTTTLQGFTGEMTEAQLLSIGYTKEQAAAILEMGQTGVEAATKVRTLTQLLQTTKESIGSGWSQSFRIVFGNFEEATDLFSGISGNLSTMIQKSADARNDVLQGWKDLGGRTLLIDSISKAIKHLGEILAPIKDAFREIFPPMTAERLMSMTESFSRFAEAIKPSGETVDNLKRIFKGFFSILDTGWEIVKQGAKFIGNLFAALTGAGGGDFLGFVAKIGDFFVELNDALVEGGGITAFFDKLTEAIKAPIPFLQELKDKFLGLFSGGDGGGAEKAGDMFGRLGDRFKSLKGIFDKVGELWEPFADAMAKVGEILSDTWDLISGWFTSLGDAIASAMGEGEFDEALDAINVALLGGIAALLAKFIKDGFTFDIGGGMFDKIGQSFEQLTGVLKTMQTDIKANVILKIAGAVGILTASVVALSLIDSAALTKAMTAMAIGFGQLMGSFAIISKMSMGPSGAASMALLGGSLITFAGAILVLSLAAKSLSELDWDELARGLTGVTVLLGVVTAAVLPLSKMSGSFLRTGIGLIGVAFAIRILAEAVEKFADMSWGEMGRGLAGVAIGIGLIAGAMRLMPQGMALQGLGLLLLAASLNILAIAVGQFSDMDWAEMGKGFAGIAAGLLIIGLATKLMPPTMPLIGAGLILVGIALGYIGDAIASIANLSWTEIAKGLVGIAAALLILAVGTQAMTGAIPGAIAIGIVSGSLLLLAEVLKEFANIKFSELLIGLAGIAIALGVLGVAAMLLQPALGPMMLLGAALLLIGAGFALFGLGASLVAEAFERLAKSGEKGSAALVKALENIGKAIPALAKGFGEGMLEIFEILVAAAPEIAKGLGKLLSALLVELERLIPQAAAVIDTLITELLKLVREKIPEFALLGVDILLGLLQGIRDNIGEIVTVVGEIITEFLDAFSVQLTEIVQATADLITTFFEDVAYAVGQVAATLMVGVGISFMEGFVDGIEEKVPGIKTWFEGLPATVVKWIGDTAKTLWRKGWDFIVGLAKGVSDKAASLGTWFKELPQRVFNWIGSTISKLWQKGWDFIVGLLNGIEAKIGAVQTWFSQLPGKIAGWLGSTVSLLFTKGLDIISGLWDGLINKLASVKTWVEGIPGKIVGWIPNPIDILYGIGHSIVVGFRNGLSAAWHLVSGWWSDRLDDLVDVADKVWIFNSPSHVTEQMGEWIMEGFAVGISNDKSAENAMSDAMTTTQNVLTDALASISDSMANMDEFNPTITPVLDLTDVQTEALKIADYINTNKLLVPVMSTGQANVIATSGSSFEADDPVKAPAGSGEVKFEQNIYAPKQLSTEDIYRQTRNQITMAKQELSIP